MLKKVAFTMYAVENIVRAQTFYEQMLGLKRCNVADGGQWVEYDLPDGGCLALTTLAEGVKPGSNAGGTIAFEVDDLDKLVAYCKNNKVKFKADIFTTPVCRMAIIYDSEGNAVLLHQLKRKS